MAFLASWLHMTTLKQQSGNIGGSHGNLTYISHFTSCSYHFSQFSILIFCHQTRCWTRFQYFPSWWIGGWLLFSCLAEILKGWVDISPADYCSYCNSSYSFKGCLPVAFKPPGPSFSEPFSFARLIWSGIFVFRTLSGSHTIEEKDVFKPEIYGKQPLSTARTMSG